MIMDASNNAGQPPLQLPSAASSPRKTGRPRGRPKKVHVPIKAEGQEPVKKRRGRKKREKDAPRRPLSAYNLYFKTKRTSLINSKTPESIISEAESLREPNPEDTNKRLNLFQALAVLISKQWKLLEPDEKKPFEDQAKDEMVEYRKKLGEYQLRLAQKSINEAAKKEEEEGAEQEDASGEDAGAVEEDDDEDNVGGGEAWPSTVGHGGVKQELPLTTAALSDSAQVEPREVSDHMPGMGSSSAVSGGLGLPQQQMMMGGPHDTLLGNSSALSGVASGAFSSQLAGICGNDTASGGLDHSTFPQLATTRQQLQQQMMMQGGGGNLLGSGVGQATGLFGAGAGQATALQEMMLQQKQQQAPLGLGGLNFGAASALPQQSLVASAGLSQSLQGFPQVGTAGLPGASLMDPTSAMMGNPAQLYGLSGAGSLMPNPIGTSSGSMDLQAYLQKQSQQQQLGLGGITSNPSMVANAATAGSTSGADMSSLSSGGVAAPSAGGDSLLGNGSQRGIQAAGAGRSLTPNALGGGVDPSMLTSAGGAPSSMLAALQQQNQPGEAAGQEQVSEYLRMLQQQQAMPPS